MLTDSSLATLADVPGGINETFYYEAEQLDVAGNLSNASGVLAVYVNTIPPAAPTSLTLDPSIVSTSPPLTTSNIHPLFDVTGLLTGGTPVVSDQLFLYRSINGSTPILVGTAAVGATQVADMLGATTDGVYTYYVAQQDVYGNFSPLSAGLVVTINTQVPPGTPYLNPIPVVIGGKNYYYDSGRSNTDDITDIAIPMPTPGTTPTFTPPVFDVPTTAPPAGQPATTTLELLRSTSAIPARSPSSGRRRTARALVLVTDTTLVALADVPGGINQTFYYEAEQVDAAGIVSNRPPSSRSTLTRSCRRRSPRRRSTRPRNSGLVPSQNITNVTHPTFDASGLGSVTVELGRLPESARALPVVQRVGTGPGGHGGGGCHQGDGHDRGLGERRLRLLRGPGGRRRQRQQYQLIQGGITVTINTTVPVAPTLNLLPADDSGLPSHPNVTNVQSPRVYGTAP